MTTRRSAYKYPGNHPHFVAYYQSGYGWATRRENCQFATEATGYSKATTEWRNLLNAFRRPVVTRGLNFTHSLSRAAPLRLGKVVLPLVGAVAFTLIFITLLAFAGRGDLIF